MSFNVFWSHERICFNFFALSYETDNGDCLIDFTSRSLTKAKKIYNQIKKEMLPLMLGMTRFRKYLLGWAYKKRLSTSLPLADESLYSSESPYPKQA